MASTSEYRKTCQLNVRMTKDQRKKLRLASVIVSRLNKRPASSGDTLLQLAMPEIDRLVEAERETLLQESA